MADNNFEIPDSWYSAETAMYLDMVGGDPLLAADQGLQTLYHNALFGDLSGEQQQEIYFMLVEYMRDEYGLDFEDVFDWEAFKEWYEQTK